MPAPRARWLVVLATAAAIVLVPLLVEARPVPRSLLSAGDLAARVRASGGVPWSGDIVSDGGLQLPQSDSFAGLGDLLGQQNQLRAWWRDGRHWRVDRIRGTGEADLIRSGQESIRWVFESETATISPVSKVRFPDASDLLPPTLARSVLQGARDDELSTLPARRLAGLAAAGLRLVPRDPAATLRHVDIWADPTSGLPVRVELYGVGSQPVLTTTLQDLALGPPPAGVTDFEPPDTVQLNYDQSVDAAAAANAYAPVRLPRGLAGLTARDGDRPAAVGVYGRGPTTLLVLPLRGQVAVPLRVRLETSATAQQTAVGVLAPVGPVNLMLTDDPVDDSGFLLAGTVTATVLQRAATELAGLR